MGDSIFSFFGPFIFALFLPLVIALYSGAFFYSLVHYRKIKGRSWLFSIAISLLWMVFYATLTNLIPDRWVLPKRLAPYVQAVIIAVIFTVPYIMAIRLYLKSKHV